MACNLYLFAVLEQFVAMTRILGLMGPLAVKPCIMQALLLAGICTVTQSTPQAL